MKKAIYKLEFCITATTNSQPITETLKCTHEHFEGLVPAEWFRDFEGHLASDDR